MKMSQFTFRDQIVSFEDSMDTYLKKKSTDCILYSEDGGKFKVHKEMFGQTTFLRKILSSANERCCGTIEVFCPCSKEELSHLVNFLYDGEIHCARKEFDSLKILENLRKIFGFGKNLSFIVKTVNPTKRRQKVQKYGAELNKDFGISKNLVQSIS